MRLYALVLCFFTTTIAAAQAPSPESLRALFPAPPKQADNNENPITNAKVALGKKLFLDARLSQDGKISCNSCHNLSTFGVDNDATSIGHDGQRGNRNSPTVYNAAPHVAQFWDGRAKDVEEQALGPIMNPVEMAMTTPDEVIARLKALPEYHAAFAKAFPNIKDPVTFDNVGKAIGAFERTLITPSRFDDYVAGDTKALTKAEFEGLQTFMNAGCTACHFGVGVGGGMFQKIGLVKPYATEDLGRYQITKSEQDKYFFKVPSLRNIEKTFPYFHDGKVKTLAEAVILMARHQLGRDLTEKETQLVVTFLKSLTGRIPESGKL